MNAPSGQGRQGEGFAGLSSLVSDVDDVVEKSDHTGLHNSSSERESSPVRTSAATEATSSAQTRTGEVATKARGEGSAINWLSSTRLVIGGLLLVGLGAGITLLWTRSPDSGSQITNRAGPGSTATFSPPASGRAGPSATTQAAGFAATHVIAAINANLRDSASGKARVARVVKRGESIQALMETDDFVQVRLDDGATGWIAKELLIPATELQRLQSLSPQQYIEQRAGEDRITALFRQREPQMKEFILALYQIGNRSAATQQSLVSLESAKAYTLLSDEAASVGYGLSGKAAAAASDYEEAARATRAAIVAAPTNADNHIAFALVSYEAGQHEATIAVAKVVPFLAPRTTNAWVVFGLAEALDDKDGSESAATGAFILSVRLSRNPAFTRKYLAGLAAKATNPRVRQWILAALKEEAANPDLFPPNA